MHIFGCCYAVARIFGTGSAWFCGAAATVTPAGRCGRDRAALFAPRPAGGSRAGTRPVSRHVNVRRAAGDAALMTHGDAALMTHGDAR